MNEAKIQQLKSEIEAVAARLDKLKAELEWAMTREPSIEDRWRPAEFQTYYTIDSGCKGRSNVWTNRVLDDARFDSYGCWETQERAEEVAQKVKLLSLIEQIHDILCPDYKPDWSDREETKYRVFYNSDECLWNAAGDQRYCSTFVCFDTHEHAGQACKILNDMGIKPV